ncbi:hypothetical protein BDA96_08G151400 [Sorghum bicolor]|jgi:hypothetical protein|uniref:Uncharacterized protein n=2 Tax=Sorghum bicolor TaxID=4558 RepID=A0A921U7N1_SORBI|nr:hypothetical protein BDA96_08G151400 [Sorghum bicolor]KXG23762.1 hypothetical protein SORBI_3008G137000 [Sorghum bicolor]
MSTNPPLAVVLLATAAMTLLLAATSSVSPAAAAATVGGGRMVFVHGTGTKVVAGARGTEWRRHYLAPRVEDEVAPEFGGILATTDSRGGGISAGVLNKNRLFCPSSSQCAAKGGGSYTRPCTYKNQCPH